MNPKPGDIVEVITMEKKVKGILMPKPELFGEDTIVLKLDNGYNIGIDRKKIKEIRVIEQYKEKKDAKDKAKPNKKGEISLTETFGQMVKDGKIIYGYQCEGRWWECGNKEDWLKSFVYFAARHPQFGKEVRKFMREEKLA